MLCSLHLQKGEAPEALAASKRELEIKRAGSASKGAKIFYKVTVKVTAFPHPSHARVKSPVPGGRSIASSSLYTWQLHIWCCVYMCFRHHDSGASLLWYKDTAERALQRRSGSSEMLSCV